MGENILIKHPNGFKRICTEVGIRLLSSADERHDQPSNPVCHRLDQADYQNSPISLFLNDKISDILKSTSDKAAV